MKRASELEWLKWFYTRSDFGPADDDVVQLLKEQFQQETGLALPEEYEDEEHGNS